MKQLFHKYKHAWVFLYAFIYFPWFSYVEKHITKNFHVIHTALDEKIPFIEAFIIPYYLWFPFMVVPVLYFLWKDKEEFYAVTKFLIIGMTVFLIISSIYPNGQILRPTTFERDNIFVDMVKQLYKVDTPTNIFPSIHVYNSIGIYIAVKNSKHLKSYKWVQVSTLILTVLIILSTVFLKQHSVLDVVGAGLMAVPVYYVSYVYEPKKVHAFKKVTI